MKKNEMKFTIVSFALFVASTSNILLGAQELPDLSDDVSGVANEKAVMTLKPGETVTIVTRKVTKVYPSQLTAAQKKKLLNANLTVESSEASAVPVSEKKSETAPVVKPVSKQSIKPSIAPWRCKSIPDEAFVELGTYGKKVRTTKTQWETKAVKFVLTYGALCPSFSALEKELPPNLTDRKYTDMLSVIYKLNLNSSKAKLLKIAREDELAGELEKFERKYQKHEPSISQLTAFQGKYDMLAKESRAANEILKLKYSEEIHGLAESRDFLLKFVKKYLKKRDNTQPEAIVSLKALVKGLTVVQKKNLKEYAVKLLLNKEFPRADLSLPTQVDNKLTKSRKTASVTPASLNLTAQNNHNAAIRSKKEFDNKAAVETLIWELQ